MSGIPLCMQLQCTDAKVLGPRNKVTRCCWLGVTYVAEHFAIFNIQPGKSGCPFTFENTSWFTWHSHQTTEALITGGKNLRFDIKAFYIRNCVVMMHVHVHKRTKHK